MKALLIIETDDATRTFLADNLEADGYRVSVGTTTAKAGAVEGYDLIVFDPSAAGDDASAIAFVAEAQAAGAAVIVCGRRGGEVCTEANDYLIKPFSYPELRARVAALLRKADPDKVIKVGPLEVYPDRTVLLRGRSVQLSQKEYALLRALAIEPTRVFTKDELLRAVWGFRSLGSPRTLDTHAVRLRQKLGVEGDAFVPNIWGVGYRLVEPVLPNCVPLDRWGRPTESAQN